jgi:hypothetical protein
MKNNKISYIKVDDDRIINLQAIKWVKKWVNVYIFVQKVLGVH